MIDYVSLHNHTSFSIMDALISPMDLFKRVAEFDQKAVAITDHGSLAGLWDSYKASKKTGVKLIAGCEFNFVNDVKAENQPLRHVVILAKNAIGYKNLLLLSKKGFDNYIVLFKKAVPRIDWKLLEEHSEGLICTTACGNGIISSLLIKKQFDAAKEQLLKLKAIFGDNLAVELQPHALVRKATAYSGYVDQRFINVELSKLAIELGIRCIAATDVHYLEKEHHKAHDVLLAIGSGQPINSGNRLRYNVPEFHVKSGIEVAQYFIRLKGIWTSEFIHSLFENTIYFADQCEEPAWIDPKFSNPTGKELPEFPVRNQPDYDEFLLWKKDHPETDNLLEAAGYLRYRCEQEFVKKVPVGKEKEYRERLNEELDVFEYCGVSSYMLIVADYVKWAKDNEIAVGTGRGSVGGSYAAYLLDIHCADPIKYGLVFARFHNKLKHDYSDIDLDFEASKRHFVQDYISRKYGQDHVANVTNYNTETPKVYIKDIARTFEFGGSRTDSAKIGNDIADLIPADVKTMANAFETSPLLNEWAVQYPELRDYQIIGGKVRNLSTHAAALVISKRPLHDIIPLRRDIDNNLALEFEKERAEQVGLVKMDLLGLSTLDIIEDTFDLIKKSGKNVPNIDIEAYDEKTYDLISAGNTFCVFQFGTSGGTINICKKFKPKSIEDLALITTLARPNAKEIVDDFFKVKEGNGTSKILSLHPKLERAFKLTYGFALYDESLLILAEDIAGWNLAEADSLRKLTKEKGKNPEKAKKWEADFINGAIKNGINKNTAEQIWIDIVQPFAKYSFNKAHAVLYSMISYQTAYLKAHYPVEFLVANLLHEVGSNAKQAKDNILKIKNEIRELGVKIVAPDINSSEMTYKIIDDHTLMTGLDALKYMGKDAIPEIIAKRPFTSFEDFLAKIDGKKVRSTAIQAMAASGCIDEFGLTRKQMFLHASDYKAKLQVWSKKKPEKRGSFNYPWPEETSKWTVRELYALEDKYLGEGLSGSIKDRYEGFFKTVFPFTEYLDHFPYVNLPTPHISEMKTKAQKDAFDRKRRNTNTHPLTEFDKLPSGVITSIFSFKVKKEDSKLFGQTMAKLTIQDLWGNEFSAVAFPSDWEKIQDTLKTISAGKSVIGPGLAIKFNGSFYRESENNQQFILGDILGYKSAPELPEDLKGKKVKMPRGKVEMKKLEEMDKKELAEELEGEIVDEGIGEDFDDDNSFDDGN